MDEDDGEALQLPADTLQLLQQFNQERDAHKQQFESLKAQSKSAFTNDEHAKLSMNLFSEDWNASQFWYTDETARTLARQLLDGATNDSRIAVISAPSVYVALRNILAEGDLNISPKVVLLEYDKRFEVVGSDFLHYDYNHPTTLPQDLKNSFDRIICDPPFLSEDCQTKTALTVRFLARDWAKCASPSDDPGLRLISCTGERMESLILKLYNAIGVRTTTFEPVHSKGLSNEFCCYANFECADWKWR